MREPPVSKTHAEHNSNVKTAVTDTLADLGLINIFVRSLKITKVQVNPYRNDQFATSTTIFGIPSITSATGSRSL